MDNAHLDVVGMPRRKNEVMRAFSWTHAPCITAATRLVLATRGTSICERENRCYGQNERDPDPDRRDSR